MGSSRYPGKPLADILGLPMIEHVRRRVLLCTGLDDVIVATCDPEIRNVVESHGGRVVMTSPTHDRCTDRVAEAALDIDADIIVNVQGDEPTLLPEIVARVAAPLHIGADVSATCVVYPVRDDSELDNPNFVKTVVSRNDSVLYFSRSRIPVTSPPEGYLKQSGIMAYRAEFLRRYVQLAPTPAERAESVDMLRILEHDFRIRAVRAEDETMGVDVPGDVARVERALRTDERQRELFDRIMS